MCVNEEGVCVCVHNGASVVLGMRDVDQYWTTCNALLLE